MIVAGAGKAMSLDCEGTDYLPPWAKTSPVVMLHGFARNASVWKPWVPYLSERYRVYRITLPGMGGTAVPPGFEWDIDGLRHGLGNVLDHLGEEKAHFVGESSGGMFAALFAAAFPERVASLVLVETPLRRGRALQAEHKLGQTSFADTIAQYGMEEYCRRTIDARLDMTKASGELADWYTMQIAKTPDDVGVSFKAFVDALDVEPSLKLLQAPVLMLCGDKSRVITPDQVDTMRRELPNIVVRIFEGYGHGLYILEPEVCARAVLDFWDRVSAAGS